MNESRKYVLQFPKEYKLTSRQHPYYGQWASMISRCHNPKMTKYSNYGGRGISVCFRWRKGNGRLSGFECFIKDMGLKPSPKHSLDRIDNNGNYCRENCRWATNTEQANNRRSNHLITINGEQVSMRVAAQRFGLNYNLLQNRIARGWSVNHALMVPPNVRYLIPKTARGNQLPQTKLTEEKVREIRKQNEEGIPQCEIAKKFGISRANTCLIINRKSWVHVK
jgi:predicted DNA-binding protein (UPF0251 family)